MDSGQVQRANAGRLVPRRKVVRVARPVDLAMHITRKLKVGHVAQTSVLVEALEKDSGNHGPVRNACWNGGERERIRTDLFLRLTNNANGNVLADLTDAVTV